MLVYSFIIVFVINLITLNNYIAVLKSRRRSRLSELHLIGCLVRATASRSTERRGPVSWPRPLTVAEFSCKPVPAVTNPWLRLQQRIGGWTAIQNNYSIRSYDSMSGISRRWGRRLHSWEAEKRSRGGPRSGVWNSAAKTLFFHLSK